MGPQHVLRMAASHRLDRRAEGLEGVESGVERLFSGMHIECAGDGAGSRIAAILTFRFVFSRTRQLASNRQGRYRAPTLAAVSAVQ